tara:strand:+ start:15088 stop:21063 length:5976 start_codon:yes stop_codon:yes gene_type:complete
MNEIHRPALFVALFLAAVGWAGWTPVAQAAEGTLSVARITPSGMDAAAGQQMVIEFDRAVVPLGRMERTSAEIPVEITPALDCEWRWLSDRALACQLGEKAAMAASTHYRVIVNPGIVAADNTTLAEPLQHEFVTSRIALDRVEFSGWTGPGLPSLQMTFNQPVRRDSIARNIHFAWTENGEGTRPVTVAAGPDWSASPDDVLMAVPREPGLKGFFKRLLSYFSWFRADSDPAPKEWARRTWVVTPVSPLPLDTEVELNMNPGLISALGAEQSIVDQQVKKFATFGPFKFLGARCDDNAGNTISIAPGDKAGALCGPWNIVRLAFSSPVKRQELKDHVAISPELGKPTPDGDPWADVDLDQTDGYYDWKGHDKADEFSARFPVYLRSGRDYEVSLKPGDTKIVDILGRELEGDLAARWRMDDRPPNFELPTNVAVLEKGIDSEVSLYVNNLTDMQFNYSRMTASGVKSGLIENRKIDPIRNVQYAIPFGVRDMLEGKSGAILGRMTTTPATRKQSPFVFAQVTPFAMHVKLAHYNTFVWVTDLATGQPVAGARVSLYRDPDLFKAYCSSTPDVAWSARGEEAFALTDESGLAKLPGKPRKVDAWESPCDTALTIKAQKADDLALMPLYYQFEADTYRASGEQLWPNSQSPQEHMRVWGTTAQGVYRAGDTIQYKVYVRGQDNTGLTTAPPSNYRVQLIDPTGKLVAETKDMSLSEFGATSGEFNVSKNGTVGWYRFRLLQKLYATAGDIKDFSTEEGPLGETGWYAWKPMQVLVSDFTPASFRVATTVNGKIFGPGQTVDVESKAALHAGGPYTNATARITAMLTPRAMHSDHPVAASFDFSRSDDDNSGSQRMIAQLEQPLDAQGLAKVAIKIPEEETASYGNLVFESAVADDRGKNIANATTATFAATDRFVGLKPTAWIFQAAKPASYEYVVVDAEGVPVRGAVVELEVAFKNVTAARVKSAGNVYQTVYNTSWDKAGSCSGKSEEGAATCTFTPAEAGEYRITATVKGTGGKSHIASSDFWVTGRNVVLWESEPDRALQMFPEQAKYKVGDTARYLIKNPYPNAKALITIERYGVIDHFVQTFDSSTPIVEFPVKPEYAPGFYVSIVLVSPRVDKPLDANMVDLGKPAFRMGYVSVPVTDPYNEMVISAKAGKEEYRPGDTVSVKLHAEPRHKGGNEPVEFAVAVLDQAVFDLVTGGNSYFDPYHGMYRLDGLDVHNYNLLLNLVGRQKFEKKGANPGGDGGPDLKLRDVTKFVAFWNPSVLADAKGNASIEFEAPDNLTGWRVLALAVDPAQKMGLGVGEFKVNRETEIRPVMPNQVLEGDSFSAGFSVMNRTKAVRDITVTISAEGDLADNQATTTEKVIKLEPFSRSTVFVPLTAGMIETKRNVPAGAIGFKVSAGDDIDKDGFVYSLPVGKGIDLVTTAFYGTTDSANVVTPVAFPKTIRSDAGDLTVTLSPTVITDVASAFRYIALYPFYCWEQRLTKGVMAANFAALRKYLPAELDWKDAPKTLADTIKSAADFQAPNGGMAYWVATNDRVDPYLSAYTALGFTWLHDRGADAPTPVNEKLQAYLQEFLRKDTAPDYYSKHMTASVRAVALAALGRDGRVTLRDIERLRPEFLSMGLFGNAMVLQAALSLKDGEGAKLSREMVDLILSHSNQTSGKFLFTEEIGAGYARILSTPLRDNCAILTSLVAYSRAPGQRDYVEQTAFKLVRAISQSQRKDGYWGNTQENMFCANALADYASAFEATDPNLTVNATLDSEVMGSAILKGFDATPVTLRHDIVESDAGRDAKLTIERQGEGRLYYATRLSYAPADGVTEPVNSGIEIHREYSIERDGQRVLLGNDAKVKRGELVRVDIYMSLPAARNFVVVNDPVPGGLEPVNRDLATTSIVDADQADITPPEGSWVTRFSDWLEYAASYWSFYHQEMRDDSVRFYSDYLRPGNYHLSYVAQAIATGEFTHRAVKAEEMYDPDVFGYGAAGRLTVEE